MRFIFVLFFLSQILVVAQVEKENIENDFLEFRKLFDNNQFDEAMNYFSDFHFETMSRSEMLQYYREHPTIKIPAISKSTQIDSISFPTKQKGIYYALVSYSRVLEHKKTKINDSIKSEYSENEINGMKRIIGEENVYYNKDTQTVFFKENYNAYAIFKPDQSHWVFIFVDKDNYSLIRKIIPDNLALKEIPN